MIDFNPQEEEILLEGENFSIAPTYGKISLWFGRKVDEKLVRKIILTISEVDPKIKHEFSIDCDFESIPSYEERGLTLLSYIRTGQKYKATFCIPFSKSHALHYLIENTMKCLKNSSLVYSLSWDGNPKNIQRLFKELSTIENLSIKKIERKKKG
jgi:hypothetical protein